MNLIDDIQITVNNIANNESKIADDLRLNIQIIVDSGNLEDREIGMLLLCLGSLTGLDSISELAIKKLKTLKISNEEIREITQVPALMTMINTYYGFLNILSMEREGNIEPEYLNPNLRMISYNHNNLGKINFEMLAFAVSIYNKCSSCVNAHEKILREQGVDVKKLHDIARLVATISGLKMLNRVCNTKDCNIILH